MLLAFDSTGAGVRVAVGDANGVIAEHRTEGPRGQVEDLAPALCSCLDDAGASWDDVGRVGVVRGPGSFVGVRVGVAAARGLAFARDVECVGLDGFEVAAWTAQMSGLRSDRVAVVFGGGSRLIWREFALTHSGVEALYDPQSGDLNALRDGGPALEHIGPGVDACWPGSSSVALLRLTGAAQASEEPIKPFYARPPDAAPPSRQPLARLPGARGQG